MTSEDDRALISKVEAWKECLQEALKKEHDDGDDDCGCIECICDDALDVQIITDFKYGVLKYNHVELTLGWGGPNIYYDSKTGKLEGYWGCSYHETYVSDEVGEKVDKWMESQFMDATGEYI